MNIALSGKMCSGKSTVKGYLEQFGFKPVSLADPLREIVHECRKYFAVECPYNSIAWTKGYIYGISWKSIIFLAEELRDEVTLESKPRRFMQKLGDLLRSNSEDILTHIMISRSNNAGDYINDDLRYRNEARLLSKHGWKLVRCHLPEEMRKERCLKLYGKFGDEQDHPTETDLDEYDGFDYYLDTSVPKDEQWELVDIMLREFDFHKM